MEGGKSDWVVAHQGLCWGSLHLGKIPLHADFPSSSVVHITSFRNAGCAQKENKCPVDRLFEHGVLQTSRYQHLSRNSSRAISSASVAEVLGCTKKGMFTVFVEKQVDMSEPEPTHGNGAKVGVVKAHVVDEVAVCPAGNAYYQNLMGSN